MLKNDHIDTALAGSEESQKKSFFDGQIATGSLYTSKAGTPPFDDRFLIELSETAPMQRLRDIGFLGAIDYLRHSTGSAPHRRRHNRLEHSIGVAQLAIRFAKLRELDQQTTRTLAAAALVHDIGHGPLSHTLEPIFKATFGIEHHSVSNQILRGDNQFNSEVRDKIAEYSIDLDEIISYLNGTHGGPYSYLFSSSINLDTVEAITRCRFFSAPGFATAPAFRLIELIASQTDFPTASADAFWELKNSIYKVLIHSRIGVLFDAFAQSFMKYSLHKFAPSDFYLNERQLRQKHPGLFETILKVRLLKIESLDLDREFLDQEIQVPHREFYAERHRSIESTNEIDLRYKQTKLKHMSSINDLVVLFRSDAQSQ